MSQFFRFFQAATRPTELPNNNIDDLTIDSSLSDLQRLVRYTKSSIGLQRLVHTKMLTNVANHVGLEETRIYILPLLDSLAVDKEPAVRQQVAVELKGLSLMCAGAGEDGHRVTLTKLLPMAVKLIEDQKLEVRGFACLAFIEIAKHLNEEDIGIHILTAILRFAHDDTEEDMRAIACELLNHVAEFLGRDLCKQFVVPEILSLTEDPSVKVRIASAVNFSNICKMSGEFELFERLMPAFVRMSRDETFRVRLGCAQSLTEISRNVTDDIRVGVLVECYLRLSQDGYRNVKQAILEQTGSFLATIPAQYFSSTLLNSYTMLGSGQITGDAKVDAMLRHSCAFNFPAICLALGGSRWKEIRQLYQSLVKSNLPAVRQTLAASLHEIALILSKGEISVEEELMPVLEYFMQDDAMEVRIAITNNIVKVLNLLSQPWRLSMLPVVHDIIKSANPLQWRLRRQLALQLEPLVEISPIENLFQTMFPLVSVLLQDPIADVHRASYLGVARFLRILSEASNKMQSSDAVGFVNFQKQIQSVDELLESMASSQKFHRRQIYVEFCYAAVRELPRELFERKYFRSFLLLGTDPVVNVRAALAMFLGWCATCATPSWEKSVVGEISTVVAPCTDSLHWLLSRGDIHRTILRLSRDDRDVFLALQPLKTLFPDIEFSIASCRGLKNAPGGSQPIELDASERKLVLESTTESAGDSEDSSVGSTESDAVSLASDAVNYLGPFHSAYSSLESLSSACESKPTTGAIDLETAAAEDTSAAAAAAAAAVLGGSLLMQGKNGFGKDHEIRENGIHQNEQSEIESQEASNVESVGMDVETFSSV